MDWVCNNVDHKSHIHKEDYRQMSGLVERVYIAKLLLVQDLNFTQQFRGQNLLEMDITIFVFVYMGPYGRKNFKRGRL